MADLGLVKILGILITALMVSLGSNFWFELLNKLLNMRNAGKKPLTRDEQDAKRSRVRFDPVARGEHNLTGSDWRVIEIFREVPPLTTPEELYW